MKQKKRIDIVACYRNKAVRDFVDYDYQHLLSPEESDWLIKFTDERYGGRFRDGFDKSIHPAKTIEERRPIYHENYLAKSDMLCAKNNQTIRFGLNTDYQKLLNTEYTLPHQQELEEMGEIEFKKLAIELERRNGLKDKIRKLFNENFVVSQEKGTRLARREVNEAILSQMGLSQHFKNVRLVREVFLEKNIVPSVFAGKLYYKNIKRKV